MTTRLARRTAAALLLLLFAARAQPAYAVRGIDAPHRQRPPKPCLEEARQRLSANQSVSLALHDGTTVFGTYWAITLPDTMRLSVPNSLGEAVESYALDEIESIRFSEPGHFSLPWTIGGFLGGALIGGTVLGALAAEDCDRSGGSEWCGLGVGIAAFYGMLGGGAIGLLAGAILPAVGDDEVRLRCQHLTAK